jgi:signal transduction histidine kinase
VTLAHQEALLAVLGEAEPDPERRRASERALRFLSEALSPYELTFRGFRDTVAQLQDLTRRLEGARAEAVTANRAKSRFLAVMSHELGTPLSAIIGYADLLLMGTPEPLPEGAAREQVTRILANARHLLQLVDEVLSFSRLEARGVEIHLEPTDQREVIRDVVAIIEPLAQERQLQFELHAPDPPTSIETDPGKVRQILVNLLSNSVKFTERGSVRLVVRREDACEVFEVQDTGIGIAAEHQETIFEPYKQVDPGPKRRAKGTGLGLTVSREFARLLGGSLDVTSTPGKGSTFTLRIPIHAQPAPERGTER